MEPRGLIQNLSYDIVLSADKFTSWDRSQTQKIRGIVRHACSSLTVPKNRFCGVMTDVKSA